MIATSVTATASCAAASSTATAASVRVASALDNRFGGCLSSDSRVLEQRRGSGSGLSSDAISFFADGQPQQQLLQQRPVRQRQLRQPSDHALAPRQLEQLQPAATRASSATRVGPQRQRPSGSLFSASAAAAAAAPAAKRSASA